MRRPHTATKSSPRLPQLEKAHAQQRRPNAAKKKKEVFEVKPAVAKTQLRHFTAMVPSLSLVSHL